MVPAKNGDHPAATADVDSNGHRARRWVTDQGEYQGIEVVSERQFASVWRVRQRDGTVRLLEELRIRDVDEWADIDRFERSKALLRSLKHPAIPDFIDELRTDGQLCIVTECPRGGPIRNRLKVATPLAPAMVVELLRQGLIVLAALHSAEPPILHRDVSPDNVWVHLDDAGATLALTGFGAAQTGQSSGLSAVGTYGTLAPEQAAGHAVAASDLYGLGMTILALASQRAPEDLVDSTTGAVQTGGLAGLSERARVVLEAMIVPQVALRLQKAETGLAVLEGRAPLSSIRTPRPRQKRQYKLRIASAVLLGAAGAWGWEQIPARGEVATLGGWFTGHGDAAEAVAFAAASDRLLTLSRKDDVILWTTTGDSETRANKDRQLRHLSKISLSPDGSTAALCGAYDIATLALSGDQGVGARQPLSKGLHCYAVVWGDRPWAVVGARRGPLRVLDIQTGANVRVVTAARQFIWSVAIAKTGTVAVAEGPRQDGPLPESMRLHVDSPSGRHTLEVPGVVHELTFSEDGRWVAVVMFDVVSVVDVSTGAIAGSYQRANGAALSPDGQRIALVHNGLNKRDAPVITLVDRSTGRTLDTLVGHPRAIRGLAFSRDGKLLATASKDGRTKLWRVP